jgi:hypothetical protein
LADGSSPPLLSWPTDSRTRAGCDVLHSSAKSNHSCRSVRRRRKELRVRSAKLESPSSPVWPSGRTTCSPDQIIAQFKGARYTQGLAMVACWGLMWRQPDAIWGPRDVKAIEHTLRICSRHVRRFKLLQQSWKKLTGDAPGQLGWTSVITSKTLHFLCRSLGFEQNPPAAIDGAVIRRVVWPVFRDSVPALLRPGDWEGNSFDAYCRYMTAILVWADQRKWTTKQMEATIFAEYRKPGSDDD